MTSFERTVVMLQPFSLFLYNQVKGEIKKVMDSKKDGRVKILDVGGRKSPYTCGIDAEIYISDLPRVSDVQKSLNLGLNDDMIHLVQKKRSNIKDIVYDDMTKTQLPENSYDCVVAVEVLEHVREDENFVKNVAKVLKPGGVFIMTTPNGDFKPIPHNEDHVRHYKRKDLADLLSAHFSEADVFYSVKDSKWRKAGLGGINASRPMRTLKALIGNYISNKESGAPQVREQAMGTHHLVAVCKK